MTASTTVAAAHVEPRSHAEGISSVNVPPRDPATSWGAILAGAGAIASLNLLLMLLGTGLGLSSISPWAHEGASATTIGFAAIAWYAFVQLASSSMGGYLAGRLRTRWLGTPVDEVHFRDTAHGFLAWAVAFVATVGFLATATAAMLHSGMQAGATATAGAATAVGAGVAGAAKSDRGSSMDYANDTTLYFLDTLFRRESSTGAPPAAGPGGIGAGPGVMGDAGASGMPAQSQGMGGAGTSAGQPQQISATEMGRIFQTGLRTGNLSSEDLRYAGQIVAQRTGLSQPEAEKRVADTFTRLKTRLQEAEVAARDAADTARRAAARAAIWGFVAVLLGAFAASLSATWGGRQRDA